MDILDIVKNDLRGKPLQHQRKVAALMGVPFATLRKIVMGDTANPRHQTVEAFRRYYRSTPWNPCR